MSSIVVIYIAAAMMAFVAAACTVLCLAWSIPSWWHWLARSRITTGDEGAKSAGRSGWPARVGSGVISIGIAASALVGWYGCYCVLSALGTTTW